LALLFGLLQPLALAQAHTGPASVFADQFDAGSSEGTDSIDLIWIFDRSIRSLPIRHLDLHRTIPC
jgi:hypothetical protein